MKKASLFYLVLMVIVFFPGRIFGVWYNFEEITVNPENAITTDTIQIRLSGQKSTPATQFDYTLIQEGDILYFDVAFSEPGGIHIQVIADWSITETIGPLPTGNYFIYGRFRDDEDTSIDYTLLAEFQVENAESQIPLADMILVPQDYATIQKAVDHADDGQTILVADGTYTGKGNRDIKITGKTVTIQSASGPENCMINCQRIGRGFKIYDIPEGQVVIDGFTIVNGWPIYYTHDNLEGGAIYVNEANLTIRNCNLKKNQSDGDYGGAVYIEYGELEIFNCQITDNRCHDGEEIYGEGGGICGSEADCVIFNSVISRNQADSGGGIYWDYGSISLIDSEVKSNRSVYYEGGGLYLSVDDENPVIIRNCQINNNLTPYSGGGIYCEGDLAIAGSTVSGNVTLDEEDGYGYEGGGIYCYILDMEDCIVKENQIGDYGYGGGIYCEGGRIANSSISHNKILGEGEGGGIYADGYYDLRIIDGVISENKAGNESYGGGIYNEGNLFLERCIINNNVIGNEGEGGGIGSGGGGEDLVIRDSIISGNKAGNESYGGGIYWDGCMIEIRNSEISNNEIGNGNVESDYSVEGGGVYIDGDETWITDSIISNNRTGTYGMGGGIYYLGEGEGAITHCKIMHNQTGDYGYGAGIYNDADGAFVITNCEITNNRIGDYGYGAGIYNDTGGAITQCKITNNQTGDHGCGAGIYSDGGEAITDCIIMNNLTGDYGCGAGIYSDFGEPITNCEIKKNQIGSYGNGGGVYIKDYGDITDCKITDNRISDYGCGSGVFLDSDRFHGIQVNRCKIRGNIGGRESLGGGLYIWTKDSIISNCVISGNQLAEDSSGGGILCVDSTDIQNCTIVGNQAALFGGGIDFFGSRYSLLENSIVTNNIAENGLEISVRKDGDLIADVTASYNKISQGSNAVFVEPDCKWNMDEQVEQTMPGFIQPGQWKGNKWVEGNYRLTPNSSCVNSGNTSVADPNANTDFAGNSRLCGVAVDVGAYEYQQADFQLEVAEPNELTITKLEFKAEGQAGYGSFQAKGSFDGSREELTNSSLVYVRAGSYYQAIDTAQFQVLVKKDKCIYKAKPEGITEIIFDFKNKEFSFAAKKVYLGGLSGDEILVEIVFGNYYGRGTGQIPGGVPLKFSRFFANKLRVNDFRVQKARKTNLHILTVTGEIAVEDPSVKLEQEEVVIGWQGQSFTLSAGSLKAGKQEKFNCRNCNLAEGGRATLSMDLKQCTFKVLLTEISLLSESNGGDFTLAFGEFNVSVAMDGN